MNTKEELDVTHSEVQSIVIHIDDAIASYRMEQEADTEFGKMSLEEYLKEVGKVFKIVSDGE
jgi:hypothetical protein